MVVCHNKIDRRIIKKIYQLVRDGLQNIKEMQRALGVHFKTELFDAEQLPPGNSTRFYPEERAICVTQLRNCARPKQIKKMFPRKC